jgi:hypothetical protein
VAGEDNGSSRAAARVAIPELDGEALNDDNQGDERGPLWDVPGPVQWMLFMLMIWTLHMLRFFQLVMLNYL